jgi:hypothetical protein
MKKVQLIILVLISVAMTFAVDLRPFTFTGITATGQQAQWENLMKYKLFATGLSDSTGITFKGQNVSITDESGYVGSATGNFTMVNTNHSIGGPVLFGGKFVNGDGTDSILTGPTRFKGYFSPTFNSKDKNYFAGKYCFDGGYDATNTTLGVTAGGGMILGSATCADTSVVPSVDSTLDVPVLDTTVTYQAGITADGSKQYIYVPPETSGDSGAYNVFIKFISFSNNGRLYVVMPPEGRLTRVFVEGSITGLGSSDSTNIQVIYADSLPEWDGSKWNLTSTVAVSNEDYAGNLLIYTPKDLSLGAGGKAMQGSYISGGSISFAQHTHFAGQLLAKAIYIDADFSAKDFRYVPFDPPVLNIDPTALASGKFQENNTAQTVPIHLDTLANTNVAFDYCFNLTGDSATVNGLASLADFDTAATHMPICGVDTGTVNIAKGDSLPQSALLVYVKKDGLFEGTESFNLNVFDMTGAVLSGNRRSGYFTLYIQDADSNSVPVLNDTTFSVREDAVKGTVAGTLAGKDADGNSGLKYFAVSGDTAVFSVSAAGVVTLKAASVNYETDNLYTLSVRVFDGQYNDTASVTIKITDVNEAPSIADASFSIGANSAVGSVVGKLEATDPDSLTPAFSTLAYAIIGGIAADKFAVDATGKITTRSTFSGKASDTLLIQVSDGSLSDTAKVVITLGNNPPALESSTLSIAESSSSGASAGTVTAKDADGDAVTYSIVGGTGNSLFVIDSSTGTVTVAKNAVIDYETTGGSITLTVVAKDAFGGADTATYTVKIIDVNEPPEITTKSFTVSEDVKAGSTVGTVSAKDPDTSKAFSTLTYTIISDTSGKFVLSGNTLKLDSGETLDYEKDSVYAVTVRVTDGLLSDTATILVHVSNVVESSKVEITRAENRDSVWIAPDTIYTNVTSTTVEWKQDGSLKDSTYALHSGVNVIVITYKDPAKDKAGSDTLVVYVSTTVPQVSITVAGAGSKSASGVTIVQQKDASDTASYVKTTTPKIAITATDPVTGKTTGDSLTVKLDTSVTVSSSTYSALISAVGSVTLAGEGSLPSGTEVSHTVIGKNLIEVSYEVTKDGKTYTVSYTTDSSGTRILTGGKELYTVSYAYKEASGRVITISCETDASGDVVTSTAGGKVTTSSDADDALFTVSYVYTDSKTMDSVTVSYTTDKAGAQTVDSEGNRVYTVSYTYTDSYGNSATESTAIIMDVKPPVVVIVSPEDGTKTSSVAVQVKWTVNGIVQDTLTMQGLSNGLNIIIRAYRDKAGNEAADTAYVFLKNGKVIDVSVEDPLVTSDSKTIEKYASSKTTSEEAFGVTVLNAATGEEEEVLTGSTSGKTSAGSGKDPYEGLSGHLGPTLVVTAQTPSINALGNSATLADRVESNGLISLDSGGGWDRRMISVQDYVENYCDSAFAANVDYSDLSSAQLYKNEISLHVWVFTSLGAYVEDYAFKVDASTGDYVDDGGLIHLYFELKPDADGYLYDSDGKKLGTGAYIFNTSVKIRSTLQCELPDKKLGSKRVATDDLLRLWGYRRPAK